MMERLDLDLDLGELPGWNVPKGWQTQSVLPEAGPSSLPKAPLLGLQLSDESVDSMCQSLPGGYKVSIALMPGNSFMSVCNGTSSPAWAFRNVDVDYEPVVERRWSDYHQGSFDDAHILSGPLMARGRGSEGGSSGRRGSRVSSTWEGVATPRPPSRHIELPPAPYFTTAFLPPSPTLSCRSAPSLSAGPSRACSTEPETPEDEELAEDSPFRPRRALSEDGQFEHIIKPGIKRKRAARDERVQAEAQREFHRQSKAIDSQVSWQSRQSDLLLTCLGRLWRINTTRSQ